MMNEFYTLAPPSSSYTVAPLLSISYSTLSSIFGRISINQPLFTREYILLIIILSYVQLRSTNKIKIIGKINFDNTLRKNILLKKPLLDRTLYFMDATAALTDDNKVNFCIADVYKEQILQVLTFLLQDKDFNIKPAYGHASYYETTYVSICEKLGLEKDSFLLDYLKNVHKKSKDPQVRGYLVIGYEHSVEVQIHTKYNNFDKEDSTNFIFLVKKSNCPQFPLGSYIYGVIQPNKTDVILYKDRECTLKA
jgi:hypothetical protein